MSTVVKHLTREELELGVQEVYASPRDAGTLEMIVTRPAVGERISSETGQLSAAEGLAGDGWIRRAGSDKPYRETQLTLMNVRAAALVAGPRERWALAGDQLFVDLDLSGDNLPPGTRLSIGGAILEISKVPHRGCAKFVSRFGLEAMTFVNSPLGRQLNLRGIYATVVQDGAVRVGDRIAKIV